MTKNKENAQPSSKSERLNSWRLLMMNMIIRERARTMDDGQRQQKKGWKEAGKACKPVLDKELLARRARSNQKTENTRRGGSSCSETFSSSLPENFAKQAR
ncbi:Ribosomal RNA large subunit methyltransferase K/L [Trichinella pseudospiralis]